MSPRRLLRQYEPPSDRAFVAFAERQLDGLASIEGAPWPRPEEELVRLARFQRRLRRRFPYASVEILDGSERAGLGPASGVRVFRDGGRSQALW